jgi:hypothetical protein
MVYALLAMTDEIPNRPLKAGELAQLAGVTKDTLRFYERRGLLPRPERMAQESATAASPSRKRSDKETSR